MFKKALLFVALCMCANAHQIVIQNIDTNKYEVKFWAHGEYEKYASEQLIAANGFDENLKPIKTGIDYKFDDANATPVVLTASKPALMSGIYDAGYWIETDEGGSFVKGGLKSVKGVVFANSRSLKIGKTYFSWNEAMLSPIGLDFEIIALADPFSLKDGDKLPVLVLKNGKPSPKTKFEVGVHEDWEISTNEFGIALIPVEKGLNVIAAKSARSEYSDPNANKLLIQTSITFERK
ncbi:MAG: DUF4198 domain-containing protein [Campylobacter sp.]|nr:DUF4198 domain-containing protein [Campylobacter sp.]